MNKKISLGAAIAYMAIVAAVTFSLTMIYSMNLFNVKMTDITEREKMYNSLAEVDLCVRENYYDTIDENRLRTAIARGYMGGIGDANAKYFTAEEYELYTLSGLGKYIGVGIVPAQDSSGYLLVKEVYPDSPAEMAGILPGALVLSVDGVRVQSGNYDRMAARMRGEAGDTVSLSVRQDKQDTSMELSYRVIDVPTVKSRLGTKDGIAYVSFAEISNATSDQLITAVNRLKADGARGVILDMRGLRTSELNHIVPMLDEFLPAGPLAFSMSKEGKATEIARSDSSHEDIPLVILADETTEGAAELFVLAMQNYGRANIVGSNTAGAGDICEIIKLSDGSAIQVTTAQYAGPAKTTFGKTGVSPDYPMALNVSPDERTGILGVAELDPPYKKAVEVMTSILKNAGKQPDGRP